MNCAIGNSKFAVFQRKEEKLRITEENSPRKMFPLKSSGFSRNNSLRVSVPFSVLQSAGRRGGGGEGGGRGAVDTPEDTPILARMLLSKLSYPDGDKL